jgi:hypothetical protein
MKETPKIKTPHNTHFFKRILNMTDIEFTNDELHLLEKGLKYNLHRKPKDWIKTLALEADTAIGHIPERNQPYMKQLVANNLQKLIKKQNKKIGKFTFKKNI